MSGLIINPYVFSVPSGGACETPILETFTRTDYNTNDQGGYRFRANYDISACAFRLWARNTDDHTLRLWRVSDSTLLTSEVVTPAGTDDWFEVPFSASVPLTEGAYYIVSVRHAHAGAWGNGMTEYPPAHSAISYARNRRQAVDTMPATEGSISSFPAVELLFGGSPPSPLPQWPGIESWTSPGIHTHGFSDRVGWRFTTKANALSVTALRAYARLEHTRRVILHRDSDSAVLASEDIVAGADQWTDAAITPVTLAAGTTYSISSRPISGGNGMYRTTEGYVYDPEIRNAVGLFGSANDGRPTGTTGIDNYLSAADFLYERAAS